MNISYTLGQEDLIRFNLFHLTKHPKSRRAIRIQQAIIIVLLLCYVGIAVARQDMPLPMGIGLFFLAAAIGLVAQHLLFRFLITRQMKRILAKEKNHQNYGKKSMRFEEDRLVETTPGRNHAIRYDKLFTAIETKKDFYLYEEPSMAYVIPKRDLNEEEMASIRRYLNMKSKKEAL